MGRCQFVVVLELTTPHGCWGTLADFTTILLHLMPLSAALVVLAKSFRIMYIRFD